jgi:hypothetical protein
LAVYRDGKKVGNAIVYATSWSFTDLGAADGNHSYLAQVEDSAGRTGAASTSFMLRIDATAPTQMITVSSVSDNVGAEIGSLNNGATTDDASPDLNGILSGALGADERLLIYRDGVYLGQATVSGTSWAFADANVTNGNHTYTAANFDAAGNIGPASNNFILSVAALRTISGTNGSDVLSGTVSADRISGVADVGTKIGKGTIDVLTGNGGADLFVLGDSRGRFYDDGKAASAGASDYARITDVALGDKLQLKGGASDYLQAWSSLGGYSGTGIYYDSNRNQVLDSRDELIALVENHGALDSTYFMFV